MADDRGYAMAEAESTSELTRIRLLEAAHDPATTLYLERIGVAPGWFCLEVGAGGGSITRWLADKVGPTGGVVAADINPRLLTDLPANVTVQIVDVREDDLGSGRYDLVHCRSVLVHLPDPIAILTRMIAALRPDGVLLVEEFDCGLVHFHGHPDADRINRAYLKANDELTRSGVVDMYFGRRLPGLVAQAGLDLLGAAFTTELARPGDPSYEFMRMSYDNVPIMVRQGWSESDATLLASSLVHSGTTINYMTMVSAWGRQH